MDTSAVWMKLDLAATVGLKGRSLLSAVDRRSSVTPEPRRPMKSARPWPWNTRLDEDYDNYHDGSNADESSSRITATRASIYIGIVSFSAVIVVLCLVASSMAFGSRCCPRLARFCGCDETEIAATADTGNDNAALPSSIVIDTPPSYDEVIGRHENRISPMTTAVAIDDLNYATGDDVPLASVSRGVSVAGYRNATNAVSRALRESRSSNASSVSPPSYLQVIREWAAKGILINKALIPSPPPSYSSLASTKKSNRTPGDAEVPRMTDSDSSLSRVTVAVDVSVSRVDDNVIGPRMTSDVSCSPETGNDSESPTRMSINDVIVSPVTSDVSNSSETLTARNC